MDSRQEAKIHFKLNETWIGSLYLRGFLLKGLIDLYRYSKMLHPLELTANALFMIGPTVGEYTGIQTITDTSIFFADGLSLINDPVSYYISRSINDFGDQYLQSQWYKLSKEQQADPKWHEFFAILYVVKLESAKKAAAKGTRLWDRFFKKADPQNASAEQTENDKNNLDKEKTGQQPSIEKNQNNETPKYDLTQLKKDLDAKQHAAISAESNLRVAQASKEYWDKLMDKDVDDQLTDKFNGESFRPYIQGEKGLVVTTPEIAKQYLKDGNKVVFFAEKKHGSNKGSKSIPRCYSYSTELNQKLQAAQSKVQIAQHEAALALGQYQEAARQEAARQQAVAQEAARQEAARQQAVAQEAARQEAARQQAAAQEAARHEAARQQAAAEEAARQEAARQQAAAEEAARQEAARQQAAARETARQEEAKQQAAAEEAARQEAARQQAAAEEAARQEAARQQAAAQVKVHQETVVILEHSISALDINDRKQSENIISLDNKEEMIAKQNNLQKTSQTNNSLLSVQSNTAENNQDVSKQQQLSRKKKKKQITISLSEVGIFASTTRGGNTLGDYIHAASEISRKGGDQNKQRTAQQGGRRY